MASARFQKINILLYAMIDGIIIQFELLNDFFINIAVGFHLFIIHRRSQRDIFLASSVHLSVHSVCPSTLFVHPEPYLSTYRSDINHSLYK